MSNEIVLPVFDTITMYEVKSEDGNTSLSLFNSRTNNELTEMAAVIITKLKDVLIEMESSNVSVAEAVFNTIKNKKLTLQDLFEISCLFICTSVIKQWPINFAFGGILLAI